MQINISDLELVIDLAKRIMHAESKKSDAVYASGSSIVVDNANGYRIGTLEFDGDFWTFNPEGYGKTDD